MFLNVQRARRFSPYQLRAAGKFALSVLATKLSMSSTGSLEEMAQAVHEKLNTLHDTTDRLDTYALVVRDIATSVECLNRMLFLLRNDPDAFPHEQLMLISDSTQDMVGVCTGLLRGTEKIVQEFCNYLPPTK